MNYNFCLAPWFSLYIGVYIRPCCLWKASSQLMWRSIQDIEKIWNSQLMQTARKSFLAGIVPEECSTCFKRISSRKVWLDDRIKKYIKKERIVNLPPLKPIQVDFQLGSACNLQCRTCGSWGSCNWTKDDTILNKLNPEFKRTSVPEYKLDVSQFKDCKEMFSDLVRFDFKGGEPMIQNSMIEMIENLVRWKYAPNIILGYVTNGSFINKNIVKTWSNFKEIKLIISLDGTDDLFSYIRGYNFKKLEENLHIYDNIKNVRGSYNTTVSIYNVLDLAEINHWIMTRHYERFPCLHSKKSVEIDCNVTDPLYLDVTILPKKYKRLALDKIYKYDYPNILRLGKWLESIQDIPPNEHQLRLFVSFTREMDKIKGTNFLDLKPEFEDLFKEYS